MARPLPKFDRSVYHSIVTPVEADGTAFKQRGYCFTADGKVVRSKLTEEQKSKHFGQDGELAETPNGAEDLPEEFQITDTITVPIENAIEKAHAASGLSVAEWNALDDADRREQILAVVEIVKSTVIVTTPTRSRRIVGNVSPEDIKKNEMAPRRRAPTPPPPPKEDDEPRVIEAPKAAQSGPVDLKAWFRGDAAYSQQDVIAATKNQYGVGKRTIAAVREYLKEEQGYT